MRSSRSNLPSNRALDPNRSACVETSTGGLPLSLLYSSTLARALSALSVEGNGSHRPLFNSVGRCWDARRRALRQESLAGSSSTSRPRDATVGNAPWQDHTHGRDNAMQGDRDRCRHARRSSRRRVARDVHRHQGVRSKRSRTPPGTRASTTAVN